MALHEPISPDLPRKLALEQIVGNVKKINRLNQKTDGFVEALMKNRTDLAGLPFTMGDACRLPESRAGEFAAALNSISSIRMAFGAIDGLNQFEAASAERVKTFNSQMGSEKLQNSDGARVAALAQVVPAESLRIQVAVPYYLEKTGGPEAGKALARMAIFSEEADVRRVALKALKSRPAQEYADVLSEGLKYPWPAVAERASKAIVQLKQFDLAPRLVDMLDSPDPRAPRSAQVEGKQVQMVSELVRINHHRNCLLCHPPHAAQSQGKMPKNHQQITTLLTAEVPLPSESLPSPSPEGGYNNPSRPRIPDILVRIDVTYLRQDFSMRMPVENPGPWPFMQRFDFVVRKRVVTEQEAKAYRDLLPASEPGKVSDRSPYHRAALVALRELNAGGTGPTTIEGWRQRVAQIKAQ